MVTTTLSKLSQEYLNAFNKHDVEKLISMYASDFTFEDVGTDMVYRGTADFKKYYTDFVAAFPDVKLEFKTDFRSGDWSATEWAMTGTHKGTLRGQGKMPDLPATNKKVSIKGAEIIQFRNDKIIRETSYWNMASFMKQLGLTQSMPSK